MHASTKHVLISLIDLIGLIGNVLLTFVETAIRFPGIYIVTVPRIDA